VSLRSGPVGQRAADPPSSRNLIQGGDIARKLVTRFGLRESNPSPTVALEVVPVVIVDELLAESDLFNPRIRPASGFGIAQTVAATGSVRLQNPAGSRVIAHVSYVTISGGATLATVQFRSSSPVQLAPVGFTGFRTALLPNQLPVCTIASETPKTDNSGAIIAGMRVTSSQVVLIPFDFVLNQGQTFAVEETTGSSTAFQVTFFWTEEDQPF
jgi:hypothetical protein